MKTALLPNGEVDLHQGTTLAERFGPTREDSANLRLEQYSGKKNCCCQSEAWVFTSTHATCQALQTQHEDGSAGPDAATATEDAHGGSWASNRSDIIQRSNPRLDSAKHPMQASVDDKYILANA